jgi:hypothetical protein
MKYFNKATNPKPDDSQDWYYFYYSTIKLLKARLEDNDIELLSKIQLGGKGKLINPSSSWNFYGVGACFLVVAMCDTYIVLLQLNVCI